MKDAKDNEGRSVKILGRTGIRFEDQNGVFFIDSEMLNGKTHDLVIYSNDIRYYEKSDTRLISFECKKEIIQNVTTLLKSVGIRILIR